MGRIISRLTSLAVFTAVTFAMIATVAPIAHSQSVSSGIDNARMQWWVDARFGMFIHWGIYSIPARGEWYMNDGHVPRSEYEKYAGDFDPTEFNADRWVRIAHDAGMKYLVITSKHHDGFCMFDTKATGYNVVEATPWHKDPLKALSQACRKYGVRFCVYYSIMDWHSPYQVASDPDPEHPTYNPTHFRPGEKGQYIAYMKTQLRELVTQYHPSVLWFDGGWMDGWTKEDGRGIYSYLRKLDPKLIVNNRVIGAGDYETPEQQIPPNGMPGHDWETCMTINNDWGYNASDLDFKSSATLIRNLVDIVSKGGNYLLNVGPTAKGVIPGPEVDRLDSMGVWLKVNGDAIYGTAASPFTTQLPWGRCTRKHGKLFLEVFEWPRDGKLPIEGIYSKPERAFLLSDSKRSPLKVEKSGDSLLVSVPAEMPDSICTVVELDFKGEPRVYNPPAIEPAMRMFIGATDVTLGKAAGSEVHYTLDESDPTVGSPLYSDPIRVSGSTVISARYFMNGEPVSGISRAAFTRIQPEPGRNLEDASNGVEYKYFRGKWEDVPDFSRLTPEREGVLPGIVLPQKKAPQNYGVEYRGYIRISKEGVYTFYLSSDDGSLLYIDGKKVVDNDGLHATVERKGIIPLAEGYHAIRVDFFQAGGGDALEADYEGPGIEKQTIPDSTIFFKK